MKYQTQVVFTRTQLPVRLWIQEIKHDGSVLFESSHPLDTERSYSESLRLAPSAKEYRVQIAHAWNPQLNQIFKQTYPSLTTDKEADCWLAVKVTVSDRTTTVQFGLTALTFILPSI